MKTAVAVLLVFVLAESAAQARELRATINDASITVVPAGTDIYRVDISSAAIGESSTLFSLLSPGGLTRARINDGWLEISRGGEMLWRGRPFALETYGRRRGPGLRVEWQAADNEVIYGLGERFSGLDQNGKWIEMWIREEPGQGDAKQSSYFCTPVLYSSLGYALYATNNPEGEFDFNSKGDHLLSYSRIGSQLTFYLAFAPTLKHLVEIRARIQGPARHASPGDAGGPFAGVPDWIWGPWVSRNSFENQGEAEEVIREMARREFPVSAIVQEAWKGPSETGDWNNFSKERWADADSFLSMCRDRGIQNVLWQVPVVHPSDPQFTNAAARGYFVRKPDGSVSFRKAWLEGFANVDFTNPEAVRWWKDQMRDEVRRGVRGFKADDGEDIEEDDVFFDGRRGDEMHNEYTVLYSKAVNEIFLEEKVDGTLWCRSASLGSEQAPALWAGDQHATWPQYRSLVSAGLSAGISGAPFWGHDIGGYLETPSPELYIRWLQFGAFSPIMQYHGQTRREPWEFGAEAERAYALLSRLRTNLRPTLKKLGHEAAKTGIPLMRPMIMEFPNDARFVREDSQYMLGPDLLVAPVFEENATARRVKFPNGCWRSLLHPDVFIGPSDQDVAIGLVDAPVFARVGATLSVELENGAKLGEWKPGAPVRDLKITPLPLPTSPSGPSRNPR